MSLILVSSILDTVAENWTSHNKLNSTKHEYRMYRAFGQLHIYNLRGCLLSWHSTLPLNGWWQSGRIPVVSWALLQDILSMKM